MRHTNYSSWKQRYDNYIAFSPYWEQVKAAVRQRADNRCEECGKGGYAIHHYHYRSLYHELDDLDSVALLCRNCHYGHHAGWKEADEGDNLTMAQLLEKLRTWQR